MFNFQKPISHYTGAGHNDFHNYQRLLAHPVTFMLKFRMIQLTFLLLIMSCGFIEEKCVIRLTNIFGVTITPIITVHYK